MANLAGSSIAFPKPPTMLEQLLEEINFQRTKEMRQLLKDGTYNYVLRTSYTIVHEGFSRDGVDAIEG